MALIARATANFSTPYSTFDFFLIPAVSSRVYSLPFTVTFESMVSLVVPATSLTITLSFPRSAFVNDDLPALGLPTIATFIFFVSSPDSFSGSIL